MLKPNQNRNNSLITFDTRKPLYLIYNYSHYLRFLQSIKCSIWNAVQLVGTEKSKGIINTMRFSIFWRACFAPTRYLSRRRSALRWSHEKHTDSKNLHSSYMSGNGINCKNLIRITMQPHKTCGVNLVTDTYRYRSLVQRAKVSFDIALIKLFWRSLRMKNKTHDYQMYRY